MPTESAPTNNLPEKYKIEMDARVLGAKSFDELSTVVEKLAEENPVFAQKKDRVLGAVMSFSDCDPSMLPNLVKLGTFRRVTQDYGLRDRVIQLVELLPKKLPTSENPHETGDSGDGNLTPADSFEDE